MNQLTVRKIEADEHLGKIINPTKPIWERANKHNINIGEIKINLFNWPYDKNYFEHLNKENKSAETITILFLPKDVEIEKLNADQQHVVLHTSKLSHGIWVSIPKCRILGQSPYLDIMIMESKGGDLSLNDFAYHYIEQFLINHSMTLNQTAELAKSCIENHLVQLIVASLEAESSSLKGRGTQSCMKLRRRIKNYIEEHICDPDITPAKISGNCGISVSYLHKLFKMSGTPVCRWIMTKRLELCKARLQEAGYRHISISQIAYDAGFNNQAHFSTKFKEYFGISPRQLRVQAFSE
jgi:AraC-like DNA-binding protein